MDFKTLIAVTTVTLAASLASAAEADWTSLFDGKSLKGWTRKGGTATYAVKDGRIVGKTAVGSPNTFLCTDKTFADFELTFEVNVQTGLNSGVQIRSRTREMEAKPRKKKKKNDATAPKKPDSSKKKVAPKKFLRVYGPQIEIEAGPGQSAFIYGEGTEFKWLSPEPKSKDKSVNQHSHYKNDKWNSYRVLAVGNNIQTWLNGAKVADLTHDGIHKMCPSGFIGLQVHGIKSGTGPFQVAWRNIRIREIKK